MPQYANKKGLLVSSLIIFLFILLAFEILSYKVFRLVPMVLHLIPLTIAFYTAKFSAEEVYFHAVSIFFPDSLV